MRTGAKRLLSVLLAALMLVLSCAVSASAGTRDSIERCADALREAYRSANEAALACSDAEAIAKNYRATMDGNKIDEHVDACDDVLRQYYAGSWINEEDTLVVALSGKYEECKKLVLEMVDSEDVVFVEGVGSYYSSIKTYNALNDAVTELYDKVSAGKKISADAEKLMELRPGVSYDVKTNTVTVTFKTDEAAELAVEKSKKAGAVLNESERSAVSRFNEAVEVFKTEFAGSENVEYRASSKTLVVHYQATAWRPGRYIYVRKSNGAGVGGGSTGYRAKMTYNGATVYGFVTAGHYIYKGYGIYINSSSTSSTYKLGTVLNRKNSGPVDASFFKLENSSCETSNTIYYTSSQAGVTRPGTILDGTYTTPKVGTRIYKSGASTYLTYGYVRTLYGYGDGDDGSYLTNLMLSDRLMTKKGDSGSVTYVVNGATIYGKAVGIVCGSADDGSCSIFIQAAYIASYLGAGPY